MVIIICPLKLKVCNAKWKAHTQPLEIFATPFRLMCKGSISCNVKTKCNSHFDSIKGTFKYYVNLFEDILEPPPTLSSDVIFWLHPSSPQKIT